MREGKRKSVATKGKFAGDFPLGPATRLVRRAEKPPPRSRGTAAVARDGSGQFPFAAAQPASWLAREAVSVTVTAGFGPLMHQAKCAP